MKVVRYCEFLFILTVSNIQEVNWSPKEEARRLVVITTEEEFHIAGDGLVCYNKAIIYLVIQQHI